MTTPGSAVCAVKRGQSSRLSLKNHTLNYGNITEIKQDQSTVVALPLPLCAWGQDPAFLSPQQKTSFNEAFSSALRD